MAWIESHQSLRSHPKTKRLARALSVSVPAAIGHLHCLWWWSLDYAPDGSLEHFEDWEIAEGAMWEGDPEVFVKGLEVSTFCRNRVLHDWQDYAGRLLQSRAKARERTANYRAKHGRAKPNDSVSAPKIEVAENKPLKDKRAGAINASWEPSPESLEWATSQWPESWVKRQTETFRDYYIGTGKPMKNWDATWRNWLRRDATRNPPKPNPGGGGDDWFEA